jgi:hypothetical protein
LIDHVAPAEWLVGRAARARWPRCAIAVIEVQDRIKRARAASGRSADDQQALEWANANSNDPRAAEIKRVLGVQ